ncbi:hypothetical protein BDY19DRAFT_117798 [Irpex rosettiformis]|uniref:Uncharacterized protein n=1 Tax=Irpex rosettiformis TaxID=378272 RepID=A0ACB8U680_9APHY|nr:hypothetical protein BDY19DRAFT_117798 [Irpex rosettiformis]
MQIKLIPASTHPTILFTIALPDPPEHLGIAQAWAAQLHRLGSEELEYPPSMLALDKTTWIIACLNSVTFDLSGSRDESNNGSTEVSEVRNAEEEGGALGRIICHLIDGKTVEWELSERHFEDREALACVQMLQSVCQDVQDSAVEAEKERMRSYISQSRSSTPESVEGGNGQQSSVKSESKKQGKHKKQRSMLLSLVASIISPRSSSQSQAHSQPVLSSPPPLPSSPEPVPVPTSPVRFSSVSNLSTELRKRARSTLVDTFRRFVITRLAATVLPVCTCIPLQPTYNSHVGYFATWVAQSMLDRVEAEMEALVHEAGGVPSVYMNTAVQSRSAPPVDELSWEEGHNIEENAHSYSTFSLGARGMGHAQQLVDEMPPPFSDEEEDDGSDDSDGSSVHTPPDGTPRETSPFVPECQQSPASMSPPKNRYSPPSSSVPRSPSPPTPPTLSSPLPLSAMPVSPVSPSGDSPSSMASSITIAIPQPTFSPTAMNSYTALSTHRLRLRHVLDRHASHADILLAEERNLQSSLEIKARRRAWSNRDYMGKDSADMRFLGFAVPTRKSPLGRCKPIYASDVATMSAYPNPSAQTGAYAVESVNGPERHRRRPSDAGLVVTTAEHNIMRLFPVCEEDEDDEDYNPDYMSPSSRSDMSMVGQCTAGFRSQEDMPSVRLVEDSILRDAEAGLLAPLSLQRHSVPIRPRTRTKSMIQTTPVLITPPPSPTTTAPISESQTAPASPVSTATLFSEVDEEKVEFDVLEPQTKLDLFDVYSGEDEEDDSSPGEMGFRSEFTLSMDLPPPYRMDVNMHAMTRGYDDWVVGHHTTSSGGR